MKLPKYQRQVSVSAEAGAVRGDVGAAGQEWRAAGQIAGQVTGIATDVLRTRNALEARREEAQRTRLRDKAEGEIGVLITQYRDSASTRKDFDKMGAKDDPEGIGLQDQVNKILSSDEYTSRPDLREELLMDAGFNIEKAKSNIARLGNESLQNETNATNETLAQTFIATRQGEKAKEVYERTRGRTRTDAEVDELVGKIDKRIEYDDAVRTMQANPQLVIDNVNNQLAGKESTYKHMDSTELRSIKAYAKQELTARQNSTVDEIYQPNSDYDEMSAEGKLKWLDKKREDNEMSASAYKAERKRVIEPSITEMTPELNQKYISLQAGIYKAQGNPEEMAKVLNDVSATNMPLELRKGLYNEARAVEDPTSVFNETASKLGRELISSSYGRAKDDFAVSALPKWFGLTGVKGFTEETRQDLMTRAESEAQAEFSSWLHSQEKRPTEPEIHKKTYEILQQTNRRYTLDQIPQRMEEVSLEGIAPEPIVEAEEQEVVGELIGLDDFMAEFEAEEGRAPTQEEIDALKGRAWQ